LFVEWLYNKTSIFLNSYDVKSGWLKHYINQIEMQFFLAPSL